MIAGCTDTTRRAEQAHLALLRQAGAPRRFALAAALTRDARELARAALRRRYPHADEQTLALLFVEQQYGAVLAERLRSRLIATGVPTDDDLP